MAQGFFSGGFLNFVLDAQKKQKVMGQSIVESLTEEESPLASQEQQLESTTSIMKRRDWEWENYKKSESLTFEEDPEAVTKSGTQLKFKENAAKKKWQDNYFFTNKNTFDWSRQRVKDQPEWLQKELKGTRPMPDLPEKDETGEWKSTQDAPEFVRMKDGSVKKVHVGSSFYDIDGKEKTQAWQNRSRLFNSSYNEKTGSFEKTEKDKERDKELKTQSKFLYLDVTDKEAWSEYIEKKKDWRGREYEEVGQEYMDSYNNAYKFQEEGKRQKHKAAILYNGLYYENPYYQKGQIFRENILGW